MPNYCSYGMPAAWSAGGGTVSQWGSASATTVGGVKNPATLRNSVVPATTTPYYFDADEFGLVCASFPSAGGGPDPILSQSAAINSLNATVASMQATITTLTSPVETSPERIQDMSVIAGLFLAVGISILCAKGIQKLFDRGPHESD